MVPNHSPEHHPPKEKMLRRVIWHFFLEIRAKVKNFLRLNHLSTITVHWPVILQFAKFAALQLKFRSVFLKNFLVIYFFQQEFLKIFDAISSTDKYQLFMSDKRGIYLQNSDRKIRWLCLFMICNRMDYFGKGVGSFRWGTIRKNRLYHIFKTRISIGICQEFLGM